VRATKRTTKGRTIRIAILLVFVSIFDPPDKKRGMEVFPSPYKILFL
jgi:hypothetical protein